MQILKQEHYPQLEIDCTESDSIQVWMNGKEDSNVIQIEKCNLQAFIYILQGQSDTFKNIKSEKMRYNYNNPDDSHIFNKNEEEEPIHCNHCDCIVLKPEFIDPENKKTICTSCNNDLIYLKRK